MMAESLRILILEDNLADAELVQFELKEAGLAFTSKVVMTEEDFVRELQQFSPHLILSDYDLPNYNGALALAEAKERRPDSPFILVTGAIGEDRAIEILTQGAKDYVLKSRLQQRLAPAVRRALAEAEGQTARKKAETDLRKAHRTLEERVKIRTAELEAEINERKQAEMELLREKLFTETLLESLPGIFFLYDSTCHLKRWNKAHETATGFSADELRDWYIPDWHKSPEDAAMGMALVKSVLDTGVGGAFETTLINKEGRFVPYLISITRLLTPDGPAMMGVGVDITERKQAEELLKESKAQLSNALEIAHLGHWGYDVATDLFTFNDQFYKIFRTTVEKVGGYTMRSAEYARRFVYPDDMNMVGEETRKAIETTDPHFNRQIEHRMLYADGTVGYITVRFFIVKDSHGRTVKTYGVNQDITERKRAEEALQKSEERFRLAFSTSTDAININRMSDGLFVDINEGFTRLTGFTWEDVNGKTSREIDIWCNPADRKKLIDGLEEKKYYENLEAEFRRKNGSVATALMSAKIIVLQNIPHILSITRDISDRKREEEEKAKLQAQFQQAQKMESVGRLAGGVAHDFNNMLGVILGHAEMALERVDPAQPIHANLQEIRKAAERSSDLTRQLLAFARKQTVSRKVLDLNDTVAGMLKMLHRLIGEDIHLAWLPGANVWPVELDPSQIDQILANLSVNARDAIAGVGRVAIETKNIILDESYCAAHAGVVPGEYVLLSVRDDGCGMDRETLSHLFEPFFTTKGIGKGTGLGLATVYGIVKQNNGFIEAKSEPGQGTTFRIYLPRYAGKAEQMGAEGLKETVVRGRETVLVTEDEPAILELTTLILERQGYSVLAASTPGEAIQLAREHPGEIHLLITDVVMPEMNGRDLAKNLLSLYPHLKRLFMSGYTADVIAHHGVLDEGVYFIQKPFTMKDLAAKVREVLDQEKIDA
jgi:two-component system, cell cycle sensor histidine kinase and response regulator CckA